MLNINKIEDEILTLEKKDTSYAVVERLAWLYIVRDHLKEHEEEVKSSPVPSSEFMKTIDGKHPDDVWCLVEELVESVRVTHPMLYNSYIRRFESLNNPHKTQY